MRERENKRKEEVMKIWKEIKERQGKERTKERKR